MTDVLLEMKNISKSFNGVEVLRSVDLQIYKGKVHALVGENGAGKSTLMKILMGQYTADSGAISYEGSLVRFFRPSQALSHGISMIFQELSSFQDLTVAENMYINREPSTFGFLRKKEQKNQVKNQLSKLGIKLDVNAKVKDLSISEVQMLEIAKAVTYNSKLVIMDEPTSSLTGSEVTILFNTIQNLKKNNISVIYITHRLDELYKIADYVSVLRDGQMISSHPISDVNHDSLIGEMVGRRIEDIYPKIEKKIGETVLKVENFTLENTFKDINFELKSGEILGIAGMVGSGRSEIVEALFGILPHSSGDIFIKRNNVKIRGPREAIDNGIALVPENRKISGLNLRGSVRSNACEAILDSIGKLKGVFVNILEEKNNTDKIIKQLQIKINDQQEKVSMLSGGNQQKIVIGKWLLTLPEIILLDEPTRGIDVGAKFQIYQLIQELATKRKAIIFISSEMPELLGICDRILIMCEGRIAGEVQAKNTSQEEIMSIIVNHKKTLMVGDQQL